MVRLTGAKDHRVRDALKTLAAMRRWAGASTDPAGASSELTNSDPADSGQRPTTRAAGRWRPPRAWPLLLIALGAAVSVWSGWVGLGRLTGFGMVPLLPGIWDNLRLDSAVVLPLSVEAYGAYALRCWLGPPGLAWRTRAFARRSAVTSLLLGALAQVVYHLLIAAGVHAAPWPVVIFVATVPVAVLGLASGLARLVANDHHQAPPTASDTPTNSAHPPPAPPDDHSTTPT